MYCVCLFSEFLLLLSDGIRDISSRFSVGLPFPGWFVQFTAKAHAANRTTVISFSLSFFLFHW